MKTELTLNKVSKKGRFIVKNFASCLAQCRHLCALGLTQGTEFEITRHDCCGSCSVEVRGCCFVLDPETAKCIICESLPLDC